MDIINDGVNTTPQLANTGNYSGQYWKLTRLTPTNTIKTKEQRRVTLDMDNAKQTGQATTGIAATSECQQGIGHWRIANGFYSFKANGKVAVFPSGEIIGNWSCLSKTLIQVQFQSGGEAYQMNIINGGSQLAGAKLSGVRMTKKERDMVKLGNKAGEALQDLFKKKKN